MSSAATVYVVDDDGDLAASIARLLRRHGYAAEPFLDPAPVLANYDGAAADCIVTDVMMGDMDGFGFADRLRTMDPATAIVFMTAWPTTANAVDAVRRYGGLDYLEKPIDEDRLVTAVHEATAWSRQRRASLSRTASLTVREREAFALLTQGCSNKEIAVKLNISVKTVEEHRSSIMRKTQSSGLSQLMAIR